MSDSTVFENLKLKLKTNDDKDGLLLVLIKQAEDAILNHIYSSYDVIPVVSLPTRYESRQLEIAEYLYNRIGSEGEMQHNENNTSRTYASASVPIDFFKGITRYVKVGGCDA